MSISDTINFTANLSEVIKVMKQRTAQWAEANPHNSSEVIVAKEAHDKWASLGFSEDQCKFIKNDENWKAPENPKGYKTCYSFIPGAVVVPTLPADAEEAKKKQKRTSFKLGVPVIVYDVDGRALFGTTGNIGASLPMSYMDKELRAATPEEVKQAIDSLVSIIPVDGKVGVKNLLTIIG